MEAPKKLARRSCVNIAGTVYYPAAYKYDLNLHLLLELEKTNKSKYRGYAAAAAPSRLLTQIEPDEFEMCHIWLNDLFQL